MEHLKKEYGERRVSIVKNFRSNKIELEKALDAWKEYSVNKNLKFCDEFAGYEFVKGLGDYFEIN